MSDTGAFNPKAVVVPSLVEGGLYRPHRERRRDVGRALRAGEGESAVNMRREFKSTAISVTYLAGMVTRGAEDDGALSVSARLSNKKLKASFDWKS